MMQLLELIMWQSRKMRKVNQEEGEEICACSPVERTKRWKAADLPSHRACCLRVRLNRWI